MRRLWNWLFPKRHLVRPFAHVWPGMASVITEYRPDLLPEFNRLGSKSPLAFANWLDEQFPRLGGWGQTSFESAPDNLRHYLEDAK